jgi:hypothetical protein
MEFRSALPSSSSGRELQPLIERGGRDTSSVKNGVNAEPETDQVIQGIRGFIRYTEELKTCHFTQDLTLFKTERSTIPWP